jgi:hypothetical protein
VNTHFGDLKNQLKFLGFENVDELFRVFGGLAITRRGRHGRGGTAAITAPGKLLFFLRSILVSTYYSAFLVFC